jgi:hypothetical protein
MRLPDDALAPDRRPFEDAVKFVRGCMERMGQTLSDDELHAVARKVEKAVRLPRARDLRWRIGRATG